LEIDVPLGAGSTAAEQPTPEASPIAGFWRRFGAALLDSVVLGIGGFLLGLCFARQFTAWGAWGRMLGFAIALLYFVPLNSRLGGGQTIGKRALKIRVTTGAGAELGLGRSLVRAVVLLIPFFLNGTAISLRLLRTPGIAALFSVAVFGLGFSILYLLVCNRRTRQSLHDLVVGSYVVRVGAEAAAKPRIWRGHYAVVGLVLLVAAALPVALQGVMQTGTPAEIMPAYDAVTAEPEVTAAQVVAGTNYFWDAQHGKQTTTSVSAAIRLNRSVEDKEAEAAKFAGIILRSYPTANQKDALQITLAEGFDIGIASGFVSQGFVHSPQEWREKIGAPPAPAAARSPAASPTPTRR
jgi:uncharacterized RDD family membrane protein YckC